MASLRVYTQLAKFMPSFPSPSVASTSITQNLPARHSVLTLPFLLLSGMMVGY